MRYVIAAVTAFLMVLAGIVLSGAGHGWVAGGFGCFALAPVVSLAAANGLSRRPSLRGAMALLTVGLALCLGVAVATAWEGNEHLVRYMGTNSAPGFLVAGSAYIGWLVIASLAVVRAREVRRHGT